MVVDSASDVSCITPQCAEAHDLKVIPDAMTLTPAGDGNKLLSPGYVILETFCMGNFVLRNVKIRVCNIQEACQPAIGILGLDMFSLIGIAVTGVPCNYPRHPDSDADFIQPDAPYNPDWLDEYRAKPADRDYLLKAIEPALAANAAIPENSFCTHPSAEIPLDTGSAPPVYVHQYRVSDYMTTYIDTQIASWTATGVICPAPPDSPWNSPLLGAQDRAAKLKGKDPRVCIDPRKLNELLPSDPRPIPNVQAVHERLKGFKYITEIDLTKSFNQFPIKLQDRIKTTFTWKGKKHMFCGAPFGLKPLSQIFQGVIEQILHEKRDFATPFIDNIYVHTNTTIEDHADQVIQVLTVLNQWKLRINRSKCFFGYTTVNVLGHLLSGDSKQPDPAKLQTLARWPQPKTGSDIESFLGFTNYLRDFVPLYSSVAAPLESLRKLKHLGTAWTPACEHSFQMLKKILSNPPVLNSPLPEVPYCLDTDASQHGVGWVLYQIDPLTQLPRYILFGAKALHKGQKNYGATRRELLAIIVAIEHCRQYIYGRRFTLFTDHKALTYLFTQKHINYMMLNWIDVLFDYDFLVVHRPGVSMILPDALSRMFLSHREAFPKQFPKVLILSDELSKHPDKELSDFITQRFSKNFVAAGDRKRRLDASHSKGHFGAEALFRDLWAQNFYWPGMRHACDRHVNSCLECLRFNVGKAGYHPRQFIVAKFPFEHIAVDTITGFPTTTRGNNVILVITDICTRFKIFLPMQTKSALETARNLWQHFCTFPLPKIMQSDNGTEFCNKVIQEMLTLSGVLHKQIAAYNPRANGTAENAVGNGQKVLRKIVNGIMVDWDNHLPAVQLALNSKPNRSTLSSPASLVFGVNVNAFANYDKATSQLLTEHQLLERAKVFNDLIRPAVAEVFP